MGARIGRREFLGGASAAVVTGVLGRSGANLFRSSYSQESRQELARTANVTLKFWHAADDVDGQHAMSSITDGFNHGIGSKHKIFVDMSFKAAPNDSYAAYTTAMTSNGSPDVVMTYSYTPVAGWAAGGFIRPLDSYVKSLHIQKGQFYPSAWQQVRFDSHLWGLVQAFDGVQLFTNTNIHSGAPPKTINELDALGKEYLQFDSNGGLKQAAVVPWTDSATGGRGWNMMFGGSFYDLANAKWTITKSENQAFLEWFASTAKLIGGRPKADALVTEIPNQHAADLFTQSQVAFAPEGEWVIVDWKTTGVKVPYSISAQPTTDASMYGAADFLGGNVFVMPTKAAHPDEAALFIDYLGSKQGVDGWVFPKGNLPPLKSVGDSAKFQQSWPLISQHWLPALQNKHSQEDAFASPQWALFNTALTNAIDEVTYVKKTPAQALADVNTQVQRAVSSFKEEHPKWPGQ